MYKVLKLHDKYTECVEKGFHGNSLFKKVCWCILLNMCIIIYDALCHNIYCLCSGNDGGI